MPYELYYWTGIPGRGEFVRLALEDAGAEYRDVAREEGDGAIFRALDHTPTPAFAPPFLRDGDLLIGQTAEILFYLGPRLSLASTQERQRLWTHQIQLTIADVVAEAHDTHHPIGTGLYFEDQKREAVRRAREFRAARMPRFLRWFETILERNSRNDGHLVGDKASYADLSLFHLVQGLEYAFPQRMSVLQANYPRVMALCTGVAERPRLKAYLASERRLAFNESGIFRHYPELDSAE